MSLEACLWAMYGMSWAMYGLSWAMYGNWWAMYGADKSYPQAPFRS